MNRIAYFLSFFLALVLITSFSTAQDKAAQPTAQQINPLIEQYIRDNPQIIIDSLEGYRVAQEKKMEEEATANLSTHDDFLKSGSLPRVGNPKGDVKIVEFYDYNCGYCKRAFQDLQILVQDDPNVEITFVEMPILGESSLEAAKWAIAAAETQPDKFFAYHGTLMSFAGQKDPATLKTLATQAGLDAEALETATKQEAIINTIEKNINIARDIGIRGTPGFIINGEIYRGYLGYDGLKALIDEIRKTNKEAAPVDEVPAEGAAPAAAGSDQPGDANVQG